MRNLCRQEPKSVCKEIDPKRCRPKIKVFNGGRKKGGGSISAMAKLLGTGEINVVKHIQQCHEIYGFGYSHQDDHYEIIVNNE